MYVRLHQNGHRLAAIVLALSLAALPYLAGADGWTGDDAARTTAGQLDDHEASSKNPDDMTAESHDPDDMVAESENPDDMVAESEDPDSMVVQAGQMEDHEATSENLTNLREAKPDPGFVPIEVPGQADWEPATNPQVLIARKHLIVAQDRARAAITTYGDAQRRDYPRGEPRVRITQERDAAMKALEEAKRALAAVE
jgi:hypothetical protein